MPKVKFNVNLGSRDAEPLGLDYTKCLVGKELNVSNEVAEKLGAHNGPLGHTVTILDGPLAAKLASEEEAATVPEPGEVELETLTLEQIRDQAAKENIDLTGMSHAPKEDLVRHMKKARRKA